MEYFFTIVIPVYNAEKFLKECLESVVTQFAPDFHFEVLCVNDGSSDGSADILNFYDCTYENVRVLHQANSGVSVARNRGLREGRGTYLLFLDADDYYSEQALFLLHRELKNCAADLAIFNYIWDIQGKHIPNPGVQQFQLMTSEEKNVQWQDIGLSYLWHKAYRRTFLVQHGIYFMPELAFGEDTIFFTQCLAQADQIICLNQYLYYHREIHRENLSHTYCSNMEAVLRQIYQLHCSITAKYPAFKEEIARSQYYETMCVQVIYNMYSVHSGLTFQQRKDCLKRYFSDPLFRAVGKAHPCNIGKKMIVFCYKRHNRYLLDASMSTIRFLKKIIEG